jgi:hypothetical protein
MCRYGTAAPSAIVRAIEATGRDAILRGSGSSDSMFRSFLVNSCVNLDARESFLRRFLVFGMVLLSAAYRCGCLYS